MLNVKVENMTSPNGNKIPNQFIIWVGKKVYFQSYEKIIAVEDLKTGKVTLDKHYWNYSRTTGKYRNQFLGESIQETREKIESGEYKLADLN